VLTNLASDDAESLSRIGAFLQSLRELGWTDGRNVRIDYAKRPFGGPRAVLAYLSRYTHRVAISNRRLVAANDGGVSFRWKDHRIEGPGRWKTMTLTPHEFIRRFLMHVLPSGFHRIRHYGLLASGTRAVNIARARQLIAAPVSPEPPDTTETRAYCSVRAPAAADACSSSRPSRAAVSPSTDRHPCRRQSGSTPHDAVTADPSPKRPQPFGPDLDRHRPPLHRRVRLAGIASAILANNPPIRSFSPARTPTPWAKVMAATASPHYIHSVQRCIAHVPERRPPQL
jgi:hypothetical protein